MTLADIANVCTILSLIISVFVAIKVVNLDQRISGKNNKGMNQSIKGDRNNQYGKQ